MTEEVQSTVDVISTTSETPVQNTADVSSAPAPTLPVTHDDFDENIIPETSRDNFRKYRESQKSKLSEYESKLVEETRKRLDYETKIAQYEAERNQNLLQRANPGEKPKWQDFSTIEEYSDALEKWKDADSTYKNNQSQTQQQQQQKERENVARMQARGNFARQKYQDFDQTVMPVANALNYNVPNNVPREVKVAFNQYVSENDNGADVLYQLGKNPAAFEALTKLQPIAVIRELDRIGAALGTPKPVSISRAPDPITPVNSGGDGSVKSVLEMVKNDKIDDFVERENRKEIRRRKGIV
jgi:hypothetical protein